MHKSTISTHGCFQKSWYPQIIHSNRVFHYKPSILGCPYFWKHPHYKKQSANSSNSPLFFKSNAVNFGVNPASHFRSQQWNTGWWLNQPIWKICSSNFGWFPPIFPGWKFSKYLSCHHLVEECTYRNQAPPGDNWKKILPQLWPPASFWGHPTAWKKHAQASEHSANIAPFLQQLDFFFGGEGVHC